MAVTQCKLATNVKYCTLSALFGIGCSTISVIVIETCNAIAKHLFLCYVYVSVGERLRDVVINFETCWGFPQAACAADGSRIFIIHPRQSEWKGILFHHNSSSRGLLGMVGWPGKVHHARVLVNSSLYHKAVSGTLLLD